MGLRTGLQVYRCRLRNCRSGRIWCWYRNSVRFSRRGICQESLSEDATLLLLCSWVCSLRSYGSLLSHDCFYDSLRAIDELLDNLLTGLSPTYFVTEIIVMMIKY